MAAAMTLTTRLKLYLVIGFCLLASAVHAAPNFPTLTGRVVDEAGIISLAVETNLIAKLAEFEQSSTTQIVVATVNSLEDYDIRDYGYQLGRHWEIGQKDLNNGVLLLVAPNERKVAIEVGYGLEGSLTDALSSQIIQNYILPKFKQGNMSAGIELGVEMILQGLAGEISVQTLKSNDGFDGEIDIFTIIFMICFFCILMMIIIGAIRNPGSVSFGSGSGGSSSSSSSSWSSGSSGGFSGGGGSFGGGGASGGW